MGEKFGTGELTPMASRKPKDKKCLGCLIARREMGRGRKKTSLKRERESPTLSFLFYDHYVKCVGRCRSRRRCRRRPFACAHPSPVIKFLLPRHKHTQFTRRRNMYGSFWYFLFFIIFLFPGSIFPPCSEISKVNKTKGAIFCPSFVDVRSCQ